MSRQLTRISTAPPVCYRVAGIANVLHRIRYRTPHRASVLRAVAIRDNERQVLGGGFALDRCIRVANARCVFNRALGRLALVRQC